MTSSLILRTAARALVALMLLFSVFLLLRGHNEPGGGFIGGLVAATAFILYATAYNVTWARRVLGIDPQTLIGIGLLLAAGSGIIGLVSAEPFLTGIWWEPTLPAIGTLHLSTVLLFDIGVFLVVVGITMLIVLTLMEE